MTSRLRIIFFGTPNYAVPTLRALADDDRCSVELVVTQPDRPAGRGRRLTESSVKRFAVGAGLPTYQPASLRTAEARRPLEAAHADLFVVAAYGLIFGKATLGIPRLGCLNLHASLLPKYRGASPVAAALLEGDEQTGVSAMLMDAGLDTGPVIDMATLAVEATETAGSLTDRLASLAAELALRSVPAFAAGNLEPVLQAEEGASLTRLLTKADGWLDWNDSATRLERRIRAMSPWPRAWTTLDGRSIQVHAARTVDSIGGMSPGQVVEARNELVVACGDGALVLDLVQPAGGRAMAGFALITGRQVRPGDIFGVLGAPEEQSSLVQPIVE